MERSESKESSESGTQELTEIDESWDCDSRSCGEFTVFPKIRTTKRYLHELTDDCLDALMFKNYPPSVFQRNGSLVRLKIVGDSETRIDVINKDMLIGMMARSAYFVNEKDDPVSPPKGVASDILCLPNWDFPTLSSIVSTPVLRKDGTVLDLPGYDDASG
jgi:hypothetical protein